MQLYAMLNKRLIQGFQKVTCVTEKPWQRIPKNPKLRIDFQFRGLTKPGFET